MKKLFLIISASLCYTMADAQTFTTYGPSDPQVIDGGYFSDYSADGTIVQAGGSMTLSNTATYEHGNFLFQNNGTWNSLTGSLDLFAGSGAVTISGSSMPSFYNLQLANGNTTAVTNTQGINIGNQLAFGTGTIVSTVLANLTTGAVKFADNATYTGGNTDAQHVNGFVMKTGNDAFVFPIGNASDLRTLSISAPATSSSIAAAWILGNPNSVNDPTDGVTHSTAAVGSGIMAVTQIGFWDYALVAGDDDGVTVTVSLPDVAYFSLAADLRLAGWNGTQWIDLSGGSNASGNTEGSTLSGTIPAGQTISALGIASSATPLPVHFSVFYAQAQSCTVDLNWRIEETGFTGSFFIERSTDGRNFVTIAEQKAQNGQQAYVATDAPPSEGTSYYRIRQTDVDGSSAYTNVQQVNLHCGERGQIRVFPTISSGIVYVHLPKGYEHAKVHVIALNGQLIDTDITSEGLQRTVHLSNIAAGQYLLAVDNNNSIETFKILYQP